MAPSLSLFSSRTRAALALALCALLPACNHPDPTTAPAKPTVVCTIFSYYDALRSIAGDKVSAIILLQPGNSPHEFQASIKDRQTVDDAQLIIKNGLGIDDWVDRLGSTSHAKILDIGKDAQVLKTEEISLEDPSATAPAEKPANGALNPHIWLDPAIQITAAERIRDALIDLDPADKSTFEANTKTYTDAIRQLDADFKTATATFPHKDFVGFHSAYDYLARRYGLHQVASIEEVPEAGLSPAQIARVIAIIKDKHVTVVFTEDAFPQKAADNIIADTGVQKGILQPLETYNDLNDTYVSLMRKNLDALQKTLGH